jgi:hypothetical protein
MVPVHNREIIPKYLSRKQIQFNSTGEKENKERTEN